MLGFLNDSSLTKEPTFRVVDEVSKKSQYKQIFFRYDWNMNKEATNKIKNLQYEKYKILFDYKIIAWSQAVAAALVRISFIN